MSCLSLTCTAQYDGVQSPSSIALTTAVRGRLSAASCAVLMSATAFAFSSGASSTKTNGRELLAKFERQCVIIERN